MQIIRKTNLQERQLSANQDAVKDTGAFYFIDAFALKLSRNFLTVHYLILVHNYTLSYRLVKGRKKK